jgi:geranylgeranyl diphosphate synthase type I
MFFTGKPALTLGLLLADTAAYDFWVEGPDLLYRYRELLSREVAHVLGEGSSPLDEMARYQLGWSEAGPNLAKALRPSLCLMACEALGGDLEQALPVAVAIELVHNFSLIHDDIEDGDEIRHHRPALWRVYGRDQAIASGVALWTTAYQVMQRSVERGLPLARLIEARRVLNDACCQMIEGQHLDITYESRPDVSLDEYLEMIGGKTGALLSASLRLGSLLAGAQPEEVERFAAFGRDLGLCFQIRDDILGIWGEGSATGKPVGADIARKKKSLPVVHAFQHTVGPDRSSLRSIYAKPALDEADVDNVLDILQRWNCRYFAQGLADDYRARAMAALSKTHIPASARIRLDELTSFILERDF